MNDFFRSKILQSTGAISLIEKEVIQNLWSGYGKILRIGLEGSPLKNVIVKHVQLPKSQNHPRGWNTDLGHER
ncbi:MAG: choline kinase, partial [Saprospiraceae bacterium]|nr:choline kinase [Saprospiraceae bacterium]